MQKSVAKSARKLYYKKVLNSFVDNFWKNGDVCTSGCIAEYELCNIRCNRFFGLKKCLISSVKLFFVQENKSNSNQIVLSATSSLMRPPIDSRVGAISVKPSFFRTTD